MAGQEGIISNWQKLVGQEGVIIMGLMAATQEYKCPCCGGEIVFDSTRQKMKCPFCGTEFEMETLASYDNVLKEDQPDRKSVV